MAAGKQFLTTLILNGKVSPSLMKSFSYVQKSASSVSRTVAAAGKTIATGALAVGATVGVAVGALAKRGVNLASDLKEVQNVVDTTFGSNAEQINKWSQTTMEKFGLAELQAKQYSGTLGAMLKSSGIAGKEMLVMSKNLTQLSGDYSSFFNIANEDAFEKIRSGISGETEPLKALGINMSVANMEAYALSKGIKVAWKNMDQASQTALRYSYLMEVSKDQQGDFAKTSKEFANQQRILKNNIDKVATVIGTKLLPKVNAYVQKANVFIEKIMGDPGKMAQLEAMVDRVAGAVEKLATSTFQRLKNVDFEAVVNNIVTGTEKFSTEVIPRIIDFTDGIIDNWPTIETVVKGVGLAFAAWKVGEIAYGAYRAVKLFALGVDFLSLKFVAASQAYAVYYAWKAKDLWQTMILQGMYAKDAIVIAGKTLAMWGMTAATTAWSGVTTVATAVGGAFGAVIAFLTSPIGLVILAIGALIAIGVLLYKNWDTISASIAKGWEWFKNLISGMPDVVLALTGPLAPLLLLIKHFDKVKEVASNAFNAVKNFLGLNKNEEKIQQAEKVSQAQQKVTKFASGGTLTRPTYGLIAEAGYPETIVPHIRTPRSRALLMQAAAGVGMSIADPTIAPRGRFVEGAGTSYSQRNDVKFVFAPKIEAGNGKSDTDIMNILRALYPEFEAMCRKIINEYDHDKERVSFGFE